MDALVAQDSPDFGGVGLPALAAPVPMPGAMGLRKTQHESFARSRSLLVPKLDAYCRAFRLDRSVMTVAQIHCARGNASRLEHRLDVAERIAFLMRQDEETLAEKRKRIEEFLWLVHEANPADLWEVAERPKLDEDGEPAVDDDGKPIMVKYQRARFLGDLPEDVQRIVEGVNITDSGKVVTKTYSKMQANQELRKLLGIGATGGAIGDDVGELSTTQIVAELNALGVDVKFAVQVTSSR